MYSFLHLGSTNQIKLFKNVMLLIAEVAYMPVLSYSYSTVQTLNISKIDESLNKQNKTKRISQLEYLNVFNH